MLAGREHVDRESASDVESGEIRGLPREAPEDERGIEGYGGERIHRQPDSATALRAGGDNGYACRELTERVAKIPPVEALCFCL